MREETSQERYFGSLLSGELRKNARVTFGYDDYLRIAHRHLASLFGDAADWSRSLALYREEGEARARSRISGRCESLPLLTKDGITEMLRREETYGAETDALCAMAESWREGHEPGREETLEAARRLGLLPDREKDGLTRLLVRRAPGEGAMPAWDEERLGLLSLTADLLLCLYTPGLQLTFPGLGTAVTQRKGEFFYRGENAFYASSKPGLFRGNPDRLQILIDYCLLEEACFFLDEMDAVSRWGASGVNYFALAQHYGMKTPMTDVTSDLKTALFFLCCVYENGSWRPLRQSETAEKEARRGLPPGGDARYGVLYRTPSEVNDIRWALSDGETDLELITPVGVQPFMRCSSQRAYTRKAASPGWDMLRDPLFEAYRVRLDEELCRWIFDEMEGGALIYPHNDVPGMEKCLAELRASRRISARTFERVARELSLSPEGAAALRRDLARRGLTVVNGKLEHLSANRLRRLNRQYSLETAAQRVKLRSCARPMLVVAGDCLVEEDGTLTGRRAEGGMKRD